MMTLRDWYCLKSTADGKHEGIPVVVFGGDHADVPLEDSAGPFVGETVAGGDCRGMPAICCPSASGHP